MMLKLTHDQAVVLAMLGRSIAGAGVVAEQLQVIANALVALEPALQSEQFALWQALGCPDYLGESTVEILAH
jgi:hypothetical protein